jgi:hypothetical protein
MKPYVRHESENESARGLDPAGFGQASALDVAETWGLTAKLTAAAIPIIPALTLTSAS